MHELNYCPDVSDIEYINFSVKNTDNGYREEINYFEYMAGNIKLDNKELLELVNSSLKKSIEIEKERLETDSIYSPYYDNARHTYVKVTIKSGFFKKTRYIRFSNDDYNKCLDILSDNESYRNIYGNLPKYNKNNMNLLLEGIILPDESSVTEIYKVLCEEVAAMKNPLIWGKESDTFIYMQYLYNNVSTYANLPISPLVTPKTYKLCMEKANHLYIKENAGKYIKNLGTTASGSIEIIPLSEDYQYSGNYIYAYEEPDGNNKYEKEVINAVKNMSVIETVDPALLEADGALLCQITVTNYNPYYSFTVFAYIDKQYAISDNADQKVNVVLD